MNTEAAIAMLNQVIIYLDGSVNVTGFKVLHQYCKLLLSPYDSDTQGRRDVKWELAIPSQVQWRDCYMLWKDIHFHGKRIRLVKSLLKYIPL